MITSHDQHALLCEHTCHIHRISNTSQFSYQRLTRIVLVTTVPIIAVSLRCLYDGIFPARKPDLHQYSQGLGHTRAAVNSGWTGLGVPIRGGGGEHLRERALPKASRAPLGNRSLGGTSGGPISQCGGKDRGSKRCCGSVPPLREGEKNCCDLSRQLAYTYSK